MRGGRGIGAPKSTSARAGLFCLAITAYLMISASSPLAREANALDGEGTMVAPFGFWGQDTNGDGLYDYLWVNVTFTATIQDAFTFELSLSDSSNTTQIAHIVNDTYLQPGSYSVSMPVDGCYFNSTWKYDGPYTASVKAFNGPGRLLVWTSDKSPAYLSSDFKQPPAAAGQPFGDSGIDMDSPPDGLFNQLRISVTIDFLEPGHYMLSMSISSLFPPFLPIAAATRVVDADAGVSTYCLSLSGNSISSSGINGPYRENFLLWAIPDPGQLVKVSWTFNNSLPYTASSFQSRAVVAISGRVVDDEGNPLSGATVAFANYTDLSYDQKTTDSLGTYSATLNAVDYLCVVTTQGRTVDNATKVSVLGPGLYDFVIHDPPASAYNSSFVMSGKDDIDWRMNESLGGTLSFTRMSIDWNFGNRDGRVSAEESEVYARFVAKPHPVDDTSDSLRVDGIYYNPDLQTGYVSRTNYTGPILAPTPIPMHQSAHLVSASAVPRQVSHVIEVNASYDRSDREGRIALQLPPGWIATDYVAAANISINGIDTGTVTIDPLGNPNQTGSPDYAWVSIMAVDASLITPAVQGYAAYPNPQEYMQPVLISAWVNDTSPIDQVTVEISAPTSGLLGSFTMTYEDASQMFTYTLASYPDLGTYSYFIWAADSDGNVGDGGGTFAIRDTTKPTANARVDHTAFVGLSVTMDGGESADNFGVSNWTWTFKDGIENITLHGKTVAHVFVNPGTYVVTLTVMDSSGNADVDEVILVVEYDGGIRGFVVIPTAWILVILLLNLVCFVIAGALALVFTRWNSVLHHVPLGSIAAGFYILTASFALGAALDVTLVTGPSPNARGILLGCLLLQTIAFSFVAAGYGLWRQDRMAERTSTFLGSLLVVSALLAALCTLAPASLMHVDLSVTMKVLHAVNLGLLGLVAAKTLRSHVIRPQGRTALIPAAFTILALGQGTSLLWSLDGGIASIVLASITALIGLSMLLWTALAPKRRAANA